MPPHVPIHPSSAGRWERLAADVTDLMAALADDVDSIRSLDAAPPPVMLPFLVWQYGLGELTPYVPNLFQLIEDGIRWQRIRGTPAAVAKGLGWVGYSGRLEEAATRRRRWNKFQIELDRVRDDEAPDLLQIDGIAGLSAPIRSRFVRGFRGYDVRPLEFGYKRFSSGLYSDWSGAAYPPTRARWSFGRRYELPHVVRRFELIALGAWVEPVSGAELWADADSLWVSAEYQWSAPAAVARRKAIADVIAAKSAYVVLFRSDDSVIGARRATVHPVRLDAGGIYDFDGSKWSIDADAPDRVRVSALTGFGDGAGNVAARAAILFDPQLAEGIPAGRLWLQPGEWTGGVLACWRSIEIPMGATVREEITYSLDIESGGGFAALNANGNVIDVAGSALVTGW